MPRLARVISLPIAIPKRAIVSAPLRAPCRLATTGPEPSFGSRPSEWSSTTPIGVSTGERSVRATWNASCVDDRAIEKPAVETERASRSDRRVDDSAVDAGDCAHTGNGGGRSDDRNAGVTSVDVAPSASLILLSLGVGGGEGGLFGKGVVVVQVVGLRRLLVVLVCKGVLNR